METFPRYWPFVRGILRSPVNSPHKGQWRGALMFSLICVWINGWVNNLEAGDLRRCRAHYDVIVMEWAKRIVWGVVETPVNIQSHQLRSLTKAIRRRNTGYWIAVRALCIYTVSERDKKERTIYRKPSNIRGTFVGNKTVAHWYVVVGDYSQVVCI